MEFNYCKVEGGQADFSGTMRNLLAALLLLVWVPSTFGQGRMPKDLKESEEKEGQTDSYDGPVTYRPGLEGIETLLLSVIQTPEALKKCGSEKDVKKFVEKRVKKEDSLPHLAKEKEHNLPVLEFWLESPEDNPELFQAMVIPNEFFAFALQLKIISYPKSEKKPQEAAKSFVALQGNSIWWGEKKDCKNGLEKAVNALMDRLYAEYRATNPIARLPKE